MLYTENGSQARVEEVVDWVGNALDSGVEFDVFGLSCCTQWHGGPSKWRTNLETLAADDLLEYVIAEGTTYRAKVSDPAEFDALRSTSDCDERHHLDPIDNTYFSKW